MIRTVRLAAVGLALAGYLAGHNPRAALARAATSQLGSQPATPANADSQAPHPADATRDKTVARLAPAGLSFAVYVTIDNRHAEIFLLDTTYSGTIALDWRAARRLGFSVNSGSAKISGAKLASLSGPSVGVAETSVPVLPLFDDGASDAPTPFAGVVGPSFFGDGALYLRPDRGDLMVLRGERSERPTLSSAPTASVRRLESAGGALSFWLPLTGASANLRLETLAFRSSLAPDMIAVLSPRASTGTRALQRVGDRPRAGLLNRLPVFPLGDTARLVDMGVLTSSADRGSILGADILWRFRIGIDIGRGELTFEPTQFSDCPLVPGASRLYLASANGRLVIDDIAAGMPKSMRSLIGARVLSIDGYDVEGWPASLAQATLDAFVGSSATVVVADRVGRRTTLTLSRDNPFVTDRLAAP